MKSILDLEHDAYIDKMSQESPWKERFEFCENVDQRVKRAIMRVYGAYPDDCLPQGICDPMFIMNRIALELGIGDGQGNFNLPVEVP